MSQNISDPQICKFKDFVKRIVNPKHSVWIYVYAVGGAMAIQAIPVLFGLVEVKQPLYVGFLMILPMIIGGGVEEIGWRGLLQPELEKKYPCAVRCESAEEVKDDHENRSD